MGGLGLELVVVMRGETARGPVPRWRTGTLTSRIEEIVGLLN